MASFVDSSGRQVEDVEAIGPPPPRPRTGRDLDLDLEACVRLRDLVAAWLVTGLGMAVGDVALVLGIPIDAEVLRRRLAAHPRDPGQVLRAIKREAFSN